MLLLQQTQLRKHCCYIERSLTFIKHIVVTEQNVTKLVLNHLVSAFVKHTLVYTYFVLLHCSKVIGKVKFGVGNEGSAYIKASHETCSKPSNVIQGE